MSLNLPPVLPIILGNNKKSVNPPKSRLKARTSINRPVVDSEQENSDSKRYNYIRRLIIAKKIKEAKNKKLSN